MTIPAAEAEKAARQYLADQITLTHLGDVPPNGVYQTSQLQDCWFFAVALPFEQPHVGGSPVLAVSKESGVVVLVDQVGE